MANHKSAEKRIRQTEKRNEVNRMNRSSLRTAIKKLHSAIEQGNEENLQSLYSETVTIIDKSVQKGIIHANAAARNKSRLAARVNSLIK